MDTLCGMTPGVAHISSKYLGIFTALRKRDASSGSSCRARDHACKWTYVHSYHIQGFINKTRAATLSLQPRFYQQDGGSHGFLSVKVSSTRRRQPRVHSSRGLITSTYKQIYIPSRRTRAFSTSSGISPLLAPTRSSRTQLDRMSS